MNVKDEVLLQLFNKSKLRNGTKTYLESKIFSIFIAKFKKLIQHFYIALHNKMFRIFGVF